MKNLRILPRICPAAIQPSQNFVQLPRASPCSTPIEIRKLPDLLYDSLFKLQSAHLCHSMVGIKWHLTLWSSFTLLENHLKIADIANPFIVRLR